MARNKSLVIYDSADGRSHGRAKLASGGPGSAEWQTKSGTIHANFSTFSRLITSLLHFAESSAQNSTTLHTSKAQLQ